MTDLLHYAEVENIFTPEQCEDYIKILNQCRWKGHTWYQNSASTYHDVEDFSVTYDAEVQSKMRKPVMEMLARYYVKHRPGGDVDCQFSGVRFNKYSEGQSIRKHVDHIHSLFDGQKRGIPVISFVGVFNDDYEGGDFMLCGEKMELKQGDCIIFPSVFMYEHEVTTVTKGTRYSWVLWSW